jgi:hypothetical protein
MCSEVMILGEMCVNDSQLRSCMYVLCSALCYVYLFIVVIFKSLDICFLISLCTFVFSFCNFVFHFVYSVLMYCFVF